MSTKKTTEALNKYYRRAVAYHRVGDVYQAVKLFKRLAKVAPEWIKPYLFLSEIYTVRQEWKPAMHYSQVVLSMDETHQPAWLSVALAATALKQWKKARNAWNELDYELKENTKPIQLDMGRIVLKIQTEEQVEIVEAERIGPARAIIRSIPQPKSTFQFGMTVLLHPETKETFIDKKRRKHKVYKALEIWKVAAYKTYTAFLHTTDKSDLDILYSLCENADIGFDNWSSLSRMMLVSGLKEYGNHPTPMTSGEAPIMVAFAAYDEVDIHKVLKDWKVITLKSYSNLQRVNRF